MALATHIILHVVSIAWSVVTEALLFQGFSNFVQGLSSIYSWGNTVKPTKLDRDLDRDPDRDPDPDPDRDRDRVRVLSFFLGGSP